MAEIEPPSRVPDVSNAAHPFLYGGDGNSELVIAFVGAVGTEIETVAKLFEERLQQEFRYAVNRVKISRDVIPLLAPGPEQYSDEFERLKGLMDRGNRARQESGDNSILALGVASRIHQGRKKEKGKPGPISRMAHIVTSLKHPDEVQRLRLIYPQGFYLVGVHCDQARRTKFLTREKGLSPEQATQMIERDGGERHGFGQKLNATFHLSDFFVRLDSDSDRLRHSVWRLLEILFGHPNKTPTFDEYAMFMAFSASLRSADLSRQVGAVIARDNEILATGANDCPKCGGGTYWPVVGEEGEIVDAGGGRDYTLGRDSNKTEQQNIIVAILDKLPQEMRNTVEMALYESPITDLTEFGRVVHAEMDAILGCARNGISTLGASLYGTTFPCHNCAKHIITAGIHRVIYIEPYSKSKALEFHHDSVTTGYSDTPSKSESDPAIDKVRFEAFVGVGPRRFFDLFSMRLGSGYPIDRKDSQGNAIPFLSGPAARARIQMLPASYIDLELSAVEEYARLINFEGARS